MEVEITQCLDRIERLTAALLTITIDRHLRETEIAKPRPRSIDRMLTDVGLNQGEVAALLGKTPQAVSQALLRDGKGSELPGAGKRKGSAKADPASASAD